MSARLAGAFVSAITDHNLLERGDGVIGALGFVPEYAHLDAHATYAGVPGRRLDVYKPVRNFGRPAGNFPHRLSR